MVAGATYVGRLRQLTIRAETRLSCTASQTPSSPQAMRPCWATTRSTPNGTSPNAVAPAAEAPMPLLRHRPARLVAKKRKVLP
jgi:hypothetical protein